MYIGQNLRQTNPLEPEGKLIKIEGDWYFKISNVDNMPPFFMSIVSDANHWMFIGSNGCLLYTSPSPRDPKTSRMPSSA